MKGDKIPDSHHIARLCKSTTVSNGTIQASAFLPNMGHDHLSVNYLECLTFPDRTSVYEELRSLYNRKLAIGKKAKIALLNVGSVRKKVALETTDHRQLEMLHWPEEYKDRKTEETLVDPSHSGIWNLRSDDDLIAELIQACILEDTSAV